MTESQWNSEISSNQGKYSSFFCIYDSVLQQSSTGVNSICYNTRRSPPKGTGPCQGVPVPAKGSYGPPKRDVSPRQRVARTAFSFWSFSLVISHIPVVNHVLMILAPGVIQLTLLNATALDRIIRDLARDPRYSSILHLRTGVDTRSSSGYSSTVTQLLGRDPSAQGLPAQASSSQAGASASDESRPPNPPALPVFPGSTEVDWMSSQLGLLSRGHYRMLDDLLSPIGRHLVPVSVAIFFYFLLFIL